jgi:retron-type reverse transcriptase
MQRTRTSENISTRVDKIVKLARRHRDKALTPLSHYIDLVWMQEAHRRTRRDGATGVDGQTMSAYEQKLEENLQTLLDRAKSGTYRATPVRRVHIPKGDGSKLRPIGIPTVEDKILQRAVAMVLEPVYEQEFYDCSYGFRPGRNAHDALEHLREQAMSTKASSSNERCASPTRTKPTRMKRSLSSCEYAEAFGSLVRSHYFFDC